MIYTLSVTRKEHPGPSMSSAQAQSQLLTLNFGEFLTLLRSKGYNEQADNYTIMAAMECVLRGIDNPLPLTVKKVLAMFEEPPKDPGWDTSVPGRAAYE